MEIPLEIFDLSNLEELYVKDIYRTYFILSH